MTHIFDQIIFDEPAHTYTLSWQPLTWLTS